MNKNVTGFTQFNDGVPWHWDRCPYINTNSHEWKKWSDWWVDTNYQIWEAEPKTKELKLFNIMTNIRCVFPNLVVAVYNEEWL